MRKINAGQEALHIIFPAISMTALGVAVAWTLQSQDIDCNVSTTAALGLSTGLAIATARQFGLRLPQYKRKFNYQHIAEMIAELRTDDEPLPPVEFMFDGLDLPVTLPESTLLRFCEIAAHRQRIAYFGERHKAWADTFNGSGIVRPCRQSVLSTGYYCSTKVKPKFYAIEVEACKKVLYYTGQLINWRQGVAGDLVRFYPPAQRVDKAKRIWAALLRGHQSTSRKN